MEFLKICLSTIYKALLGHTALVSVIVSSLAGFWGLWESALPDVVNIFALLDSGLNSFDQAVTSLAVFFQSNSFLEFLAYCANLDLLITHIIQFSALALIALSISLAIMVFVLSYAVVNCGVIWVVRLLKVASLSTLDLTK